MQLIGSTALIKVPFNVLAYECNENALNSDGQSDRSIRWLAQVLSPLTLCRPR